MFNANQIQIFKLVIKILKFSHGVYIWIKISYKQQNIYICKN